MPARSEPVILLAEDEDNDVLMFRRAFAQLGIAAPIQVVRDGEQAMAYLKGTGRFSNRAEFPLPDIFLLDLKMPRANGFEVLEWLRAQPRFSSIRVVVLTTSGDVNDINKAYDLGATSFLTKPVDFREFRNAMLAMHNFWRINQPGQSSRESNGTSRQNGKA
jgi:CheY-like chemotaxis protein